MRMAARRLAALLAILSFAQPVLAQTYKWVDDKGVVNYSNKPPPAQAAGGQLVEERLSVVTPDPSLAPAIAAMNARAARRAEYEEADWARRQNSLLATQAAYFSAGADCPYRADCGTTYDMPAYYYPYAYGRTVFHPRRLPHVAHRWTRVVHHAPRR